MNEKYTELRRYGKIIRDKEFNFESDGVFIRMTLFEMDGKRFLTWKRNGECIKIEECSK